MQGAAGSRGANAHVLGGIEQRCAVARGLPIVVLQLAEGDFPSGAALVQGQGVAVELNVRDAFVGGALVHIGQPGHCGSVQRVGYRQELGLAHDVKNPQTFGVHFHTQEEGAVAPVDVGKRGECACAGAVALANDQVKQAIRVGVHRVDFLPEEVAGRTAEQDAHAHGQCRIGQDVACVAAGHGLVSDALRRLGEHLGAAEQGKHGIEQSLHARRLS